MAVARLGGAGGGRGAWHNSRLCQAIGLRVYSGRVADLLALEPRTFARPLPLWRVRFHVALGICCWLPGPAILLIGLLDILARWKRGMYDVVIPVQDEASARRSRG